MIFAILLGASVTTQAIFPLPELGAKDRTALIQVVELWRGGTQVYGRSKMREMLGGVIPTLTIGESFLAISTTTSPEFAEAAKTLLASFITEPNVLPEELDGAKKATVKDPFLEGLDKFEPNPVGLTREKVRELATRILRPERMICTVSGFASPLVVPTVPRQYFDLTTEKPIRWGTKGKGLMQWVGPEFTPVDTNLHAFFASIAMLGIGKGSTLFSSVREDLRISYRQEVLIQLGEKGFRPRLTIATKELPTDDQNGEKVKAYLLDKISKWTEQDLERAKGCWKALMETDFPFSPFITDRFLTPSAPTDRSLIEGVMHLWARRPQQLPSQLDAVTLADAKITATEWLQTTKFQFVPTTN